MFVVFSQLPGELAPFEQLAAQAGRFFATSLDLLSRGAETVELRLRGERPRFEQAFAIRTRPTTPDDRAVAAQAEARGRAFGMAELAGRCPRVWELAPAAPLGSTLEMATLTLCAICASVALGPVLPPDHATLFGVRGAIERRNLIASS